MASQTEAGESPLVERAWDTQARIESRFKHMGKGRYGRVLKMARKPDAEEFSQNSKVTAVGIGLVGGIGFVVFLIMTKLPKVLGL